MQLRTLATFCFTAALLLPAALAGPIAPVSYTISPAPNSSYPDTGGTELTNGILGAGLINSPFVEGIPYVAWLNQGAEAVPSVVLTFNFGQLFAFNSIDLGILRSDFGNFTILPASATVNGQTFNIASDAIADNTRGWVTLTPTSLVTSTVSIQITLRPSLWLTMDEVRFDGAAVNSEVPEPSTAALTGAALVGLSAICSAVRRRRRSRKVQSTH